MEDQKSICCNKLIAMPQKGQITRHEWEGNVYRKICIYCEVVKQRSQIDESFKYITKDKYPTFVEPKCITRKKT